MRPTRVDPDDEWHGLSAEGDCEDFAMAKLRRLVELGWPSAALRMLIGVKLRVGGGYHAALGVVTDRGLYVLDYAEPVLALQDAKIAVLQWQVADKTWRHRRR